MTDSIPTRRPSQPLEPERRGVPIVGEGSLAELAAELLDARRCKCGHDPLEHGLSSTERFKCARPACGCRTYRQKTTEETTDHD